MEFRLKNLFVAALALFSFAACDDSDEPNNNENPSTEAYLSIVGSSQVALFDFEESRRFTVEQQNVADYFIEGPAGWAYELSDNILTVVAPAQSDTDIEMEGEVVITYSGEDMVEKSASLQVKIDYVAPGSHLRYEIEVSDITSTTASISVTPNDDTVGYYYDVCTAEDYAYVGGDVGYIVSLAIQGFMQQYGLSLSAVLELMLEYGPSSDTVAYLPDDTEMYAFAVAIDNQGNAYGPAEAVPFKTLKGGDPADCTFDFEITGLTTTSCAILVIPSDLSVRYWAAVTSVANYPGDEALMEEVELTIKETAGAYPSMSWEEIISRLTMVGEYYENWYDLTAGTSYYLYAFAMNEQGEAAGPLFKKEFTTPLVDESMAEIEISYKYFDGADLLAQDPSTPAEAVDYYRLQITVSPNGYTENWAINVAAGDYTNLETYPDEATKTAMLQGGAKFTQEVQAFWIPKDTEVCTILGYGSDVYGIDGDLMRIPVRPTAGGVSPISEYVTSSVARPEPLMELQPKAAKRPALKPEQKMGRQLYR